jgi:hypothetical protein
MEILETLWNFNLSSGNFVFDEIAFRIAAMTAVSSRTCTCASGKQDHYNDFRGSNPAQ